MKHADEPPDIVAGARARDVNFLRAVARIVIRLFKSTLDGSRQVSPTDLHGCGVDQSVVRLCVALDRRRRAATTTELCRGTCDDGCARQYPESAERRAAARVMGVGLRQINRRLEQRGE